MLKIKNFRIAVKHLITAVSALGVLVGFILSLSCKKKTAPLIVFLTSFASLAAGIGMEMDLIPEPQCFKTLEVEIDPEDETELPDEETDFDAVEDEPEIEIKVEED